MVHFFLFFVGLMLLSVLWIGSRVTLRGWFLRARRRGSYVFQFIIILFISENHRLMLILSLLLKFICSWPFFRFEHHIRPEHVLPSAAGHDSDDDDFMPIPNTRSSSHIDKSKDVGPRKTRQTRAGLSTGACTEVYTIYLLLHFLFIRVIILKLLFVCITSLFFPSIYHKSTIMSLLPNLYFSISVLLSTTPAIFFQLHYPCISLSFLHPFPQLLVFFRNLSSSRLPMHQFIISTVLLRIPSVSSFLSILVLTISKILVICPRQDKGKRELPAVLPL